MTETNHNTAAQNVTVMPRKEKKRVRFIGMDAPFFMLVCTLLFFGLVIVYSASYSLSLRDHDTTSYYILHQTAYAVVGFGLMLVISRFDYRWLKKYWLVILAFSVLALVAVELFGVVRNFSKRWIIVAGIQFQPSELT
ncbi:MAG: FtsW/RodA/SpoVE family cell cycle protein [Clostridia bacterium]|nr:FtsW/RodA/SpoVE family cell cycle protein [Clostridia bacterium]